MSVIVMNALFYKALLLQGEIWCWSLLGLIQKLKILVNSYVFSFHFDVLGFALL